MTNRHIIATIIVLSLGILIYGSISDESVTDTAKFVAVTTSSSDALQDSLGEKSIILADEAINLPENCDAATIIYTSLPPKCLVNGELITIEREPELEVVYQENGLKISRNPDYDGE